MKTNKVNLVVLTSIIFVTSFAHANRLIRTRELQLSPSGAGQYGGFMARFERTRAMDSARLVTGTRFSEFDNSMARLDGKTVEVMKVERNGGLIHENILVGPSEYDSGTRITQSESGLLVEREVLENGAYHRVNRSFAPASSEGPSVRPQTNLSLVYGDNRHVLASVSDDLRSFEVKTHRSFTAPAVVGRHQLPSDTPGSIVRLDVERIANPLIHHYDAKVILDIDGKFEERVFEAHPNREEGGLRLVEVPSRRRDVPASELGTRTVTPGRQTMDPAAGPRRNLLNTGSTPAADVPTNTQRTVR